MNKKLVVAGFNFLAFAAPTIVQGAQANLVRSARILDIVTTARPVQEIIKEYLDHHDQYAGNLGPGSVNASCIAFSQDGTKCAFGMTHRQTDGTLGETHIYVYSIQNGQFKFAHKSEFFNDQILFVDSQLLLTALAFSPDGKKLAAGFGDQSISLYTCEQDRLKAQEDEYIDRDLINGFVTRLSYSSDGTTLVIEYTEGAQVQRFAKVWDLKNKKLTRQPKIIKIPKHVYAYSPNRKYLVSAEDATVCAVAYSADNKYLAICAQNKPIVLYRNPALEIEQVDEAVQNAQTPRVVCVSGIQMQQAGTNSQTQKSSTCVIL